MLEKKKKPKAQKKDAGKDNILEEIAEKLKEIRDEESFGKEEEKEPKESGLEEDIDIGALEFDQFIQPMHVGDIRAPVLERIAGSQARPIFVGGISQTPQTIPGEEKQSDEFKYVPGQGGDEEPKYLKSDSRISREPTRVDLREVGRETGIAPTVGQEAFFMRSEPSSQIESESGQKWKTEQIDIGKAGREDPFKREEAKHEKYKPKPSKSY